jgi:hypothetical protein
VAAPGRPGRRKAMAEDSERRMHNDAVDLTHEDDSRHTGLDRDVEGRIPGERQREKAESMERIPGANFRVLLDRGSVESAAPVFGCFSADGPCMRR